MTTKQHLLLAAIIASQSLNTSLAQTWLTSGNLSTKTDTLGTRTNQSVNIITNNASRMFINKNGNVGIGTTNPLFLFDVQGPGNASMSFKSTTGTANVILDRFNSGSTAGVNYRTNGVPYWQTGTINNDNFVIRNLNLGAPALAIMYATSNVGIGNNVPTAKLDVTGGATLGDTIPTINATVGYVGSFDVAAITALSEPSTGYGIGVAAAGGFIGLSGASNFIGAIGYADALSLTGGTAYGVYGEAGIATSSVGVFGTAGDGTNQYGVYGTTANGLADTSGTTKWAGYFVGDVAVARLFNFSDGKLKSNIQPIENALESLLKIQATTYDFKCTEYPTLSLPQGKQLGFIAENIEKVFPELVKDATSAQIIGKDRKLKQASVSFKAVNYTGLIPVVIEAIKEQQKLIDEKNMQLSNQQLQIEALQNQLNEIKDMLAASKNNSSIQETLLTQNVPNPANGTSTIAYSLPKNKIGSITVFDSKGNLIETFNITESGQVVISTLKYQAGTYTYTLQVEGKVIGSRTMIIIK
jgi:hypothetical protein